MIHFMIDYENVQNSGLTGCEYLQPEDSITIFYSASCPNIEMGRMEQILESGCTLDICRLQNVGKNALDFYIASRIGEICGKGYKGEIAIVSRDRDYRFVQDYWRITDSARKIIRKPTIEQCIEAAEKNSERGRRISEKRKSVTLEAEFQKYRNQKQLQQILHQRIAEIQRLRYNKTESR